jgi:4-amino-4-deoxy-L-arabinose transferase-like glycosyltransferase
MLRLLARIKDYRLFVLLLVSAGIRIFLGNSVELGNDEVYYITYALYPDLSHFDHPPMVGWFIQLFTLNLTLSSEVWIRMAAIVSGTLSTWVIYLIGKHFGGERAGWYSAVMYTISIYGFIISGTFMMPDAPQILFWLLCLLFVLKSLACSDSGGEDMQQKQALYFILAGVAGGLAMLSKYTSAFIFLGAFLYILIADRGLLKKWYVYVSVIIALFCFVPVIWWNVQNDFISFTFHSDRVQVSESLIRPEYFGTELIGQFSYNNPFNFILIWWALFTIIKFRGVWLRKSLLLLLIAVPPIILFIVVSLFRSTLPHWTGPAYITLIPVAAWWWSENKDRLLKKMLRGGLTFTLLLIVVALLQIHYGVFLNKGINPETGRRLGMKDITLDMYGWKQLGQKFSQVYEDDISNGIMDNNAVILSHRWFPAANLDYYVAQPIGIKVITLAPIERIHKYEWITKDRGGYKSGMDAWFITSSYDFQNPDELYSEHFTISSPDTIPIYRKQLLVEYFYVYRMKDMRKIPSGK